MGGLVQFDGSDVCISTLLGLRFDDRVSASLFEWLLVIFDNFKHNKQRKRHMVSVRPCGDVQRFERQGQHRKMLST